MTGLLAWSTVALAGMGALMVVVLALRRLTLGREEHRRQEAEARVRPLALELVEGGGDEQALGEADTQELARLLARYSRWLTGTARERIADYFERHGGVEREIEALVHRRPWKRAAAAYALGDMASTRAIPALLVTLSDAERDVRSAAARSLGRLGALDAVEPLVAAFVYGGVPRAVAAQALLALGPKAVPRLHGLVGHTDAAVRAGAVELIGLLGGAVDEKAIAERLRDASAEVRAKAARALGRLGAEDATADLIATLGDRIPFVRASAAYALGEIGDEAAVPALLAQAQNDGFEPGQAAARALVRIRPDALESARRDPAAGPHVLEAADMMRISA